MKNHATLYILITIASRLVNSTVLSNAYYNDAVYDDNYLSESLLIGGDGHEHIIPSFNETIAKIESIASMVSAFVNSPLVKRADEILKEHGLSSVRFAVKDVQDNALIKYLCRTILESYPEKAIQRQFIIMWTHRDSQALAFFRDAMGSERYSKMMRYILQRAVTNDDAFERDLLLSELDTVVPVVYSQAEINQEMQLGLTPAHFQQIPVILKQRLIKEIAQPTPSLHLILKLINFGVDIPAAVSCDGLKNVIIYGHQNAFRLMFEYGALVKGKSIVNVLQNIARYNRVEYLSVLDGFDIDLHSFKEAALRDACKFGSYDVVAYLARKGAHLNVSDGAPLANAVSNNHYQVVRLLLKFGANPNTFKVHSSLSSASAYIRDLVFSSKKWLSNCK